MEVSCLHPDTKYKEAKACLFLGFAKDSDAYRFLDLGTNSISDARDVEFFEDKFIKNEDFRSKMHLKMLKSLLHQIINLLRS